MKNDSNLRNKKQKKINKIKEQLEQLRAKLSASKNKQSSFSSKPEFKKIQAKTRQVENKKFQVIEAERKAKEAKKKEARIIVGQRKSKEAKKKEVRIKVDGQRKTKEVKKKSKEAKKKEARIKVEAKKKAKEAKKKEARIKVEAKKKAKEAKEETKRKEEEAREEAERKEEEAKRTYEEELEEQLSEEEITGFQLEKTDMVLQSELWKKLKLSSRDGSRLALKLERMGMIMREKILEKERWTYRLVIKKIPISTKSIEGAPCLTCPVQSKCSIDGEISPKTCQWIEDWVMIELKNK